MSWTDAEQPKCDDHPNADAVAAVIEPRDADIGAFTVRRALPSSARRSVGPFVFYDHMGPATLVPGVGMDVRPHPHINLATVTYLFEGEIIHRDSLGSNQAIRPGAINWMTAGRGIVHSERTGDEERARESRVHGIQLWLALPQELEETEPAFVHHAADTIPRTRVGDASIRVLIGEAYGVTSPVQPLSPTLYVEARLPAGATLPTPDDAEELAFYVVDGAVTCGARRFEAPVMAVLDDGARPTLRAESDAHVMLLGGAPLGPRHMFWNFVSSSRERIEQAKDDWREGRFPVVPGDAEERIPLPR